MVDKKNNNLIYICIVVVVVIAIVVGIVIANNNRGETGEEGGDEETSQTVVEELKGEDLDNVDVTVKYGDYEAMYDLSKAIQNGEMTGKVVEIEGIVSHPMTNYSIIEEDEDEGKSVGTKFIIEGDEGYPEDGERVIITGKVVETEPLVFVIKTLPDFVAVQ
ncbi:hypothetical protein IKG33_02610 [Candidatus Saccharibacteria bacterium]|nr:hypothetical protein [Candidatus Saccharibacteria bacterium]